MGAFDFLRFFCNFLGFAMSFESTFEGVVTGLEGFEVVPADFLLDLERNKAGRRDFAFCSSGCGVFGGVVGVGKAVSAGLSVASLACSSVGESVLMVSSNLWRLSVPNICSSLALLRWRFSSLTTVPVTEDTFSSSVRVGLRLTFEEYPESDFSCRGRGNLGPGRSDAVFPERDDSELIRLTSPIESSEAFCSERFCSG